MSKKNSLTMCRFNKIQSLKIMEVKNVVVMSILNFFYLKEFSGKPNLTEIMNVLFVYFEVLHQNKWSMYLTWDAKEFCVFVRNSI